MSEATTQPDGDRLLRIAPRTLEHALLDGFYDAVFISDLEGRVLDVNARAALFLQHTRDELCGMRVTEIIAGLGPDAFARASGHLAEGRFTVLDAYCIPRDRRTFPAEIAIGRIRWKDADLLVFSIRNIARRRQIQAELRSARNALQSSASGLVITDRGGRIQYANRAFLQLWGGPEDEPVDGRDIRGFWDPPDSAAALLAQPQEGRTWQGELSGRDRYGRRFHVQASAAPSLNSGGNMAGIVLSFIDITDRKEAEETIRREAEDQRARARAEAEFSGAFNIITLPDLVQLIATTGKSGTLHLYGTDGEERGRLAFRQGQIIAAQSGETDGEEGARHILRTNAHTFRFSRRIPDAPAHPIEKSTITLLLEAAQAADEAGGSPTVRPAGV